ncbi:MAG: tetratricopeptide repeat protein [Candidatus Omnitrophota bacterium]
MTRIIIAVVMAMLVFVTTTSLVLYSGELNKSKLLRSETLKTSEDAQKEIENVRQELKEERRKSSEDKKKLLDQINANMQEKEAALQDKKKFAQYFYDERKISLVASEDVDVLRDELATLKKDSRREIILMQEGFKKKKQDYDTKILSLESQLDKARKRLNTEADRYHYNLGVLYVQNKEYDLAIAEFKNALGYNEKNAQAHYNLGIIYDDYFRDVGNAKYHYRRFLELDPTSDDAESVREWLSVIEDYK